MNAVLILATVPGEAEAERLAELLVAERLAACVQMAPIRSWYRWQGRVEQAGEYRLHVKTRADLAARVTQRLAELHGYDVPEIVVLPITGGHAPYLAWIEAETAA